MNGTDLLALSPLIVAALAGTLVMLAGAFGARRDLLHWLTVGGIGAALAALGPVRSLAPRDVTLLVRVDGYALFFWTLLFASAGILAIVVHPYLRRRRVSNEAFGALLLFATVGMGVLACSTHFASLFLGLEILTVSLYALLGYLRDDRRSLEAAAKYLMLAAMASAFLLLGIALLYAATGSLLLDRVAEATVALLSAPSTGSASDAEAAIWAAGGVLMLLVGFGFKLSLVPFHMWSPDVYQGAPAPVTALIATGSKGAVIAVLLRLVSAGPESDATLGALFGALAIVTMLGGNLLALLQTDIKRLLAYSSIAHIGYVFVAMAAGGWPGGTAVVFYMVTYIATTLGAFGVVSLLSLDGEHDADDFDAYRGLGYRRPGLAAVLGLMMLSLAGVPPTAGFLGKFAVLSAAIGVGRYGLALAMIVASGIGVFYYLRVLVVLYMDPTPGTASDESAPEAAAGPPIGSAIAVATLAILVLAIGLYPEPLLRAVDVAVATLFGA